MLTVADRASSDRPGISINGEPVLNLRQMYALVQRLHGGRGMVRRAVTAAAELPTHATRGARRPSACARRPSGLQSRATAAWAPECGHAASPTRRPKLALVGSRRVWSSRERALPRLRAGVRRWQLRGRGGERGRRRSARRDPRDLPHPELGLARTLRRAHAIGGFLVMLITVSADN